VRASGQPLTARQIVASANATGSAPAARTRTPTQSVNRDLHAAARRRDRVGAGPKPGQFYAGATLGVHRAPTEQAPRLPTQPLALLIATRGGLRACGIRTTPTTRRTAPGPSPASSAHTFAPGRGLAPMVGRLKPTPAEGHR
jgi:hypothetical protein